MSYLGLRCLPMSQKQDAMPLISWVNVRVGIKYRYAGIPRYFFGVVRTAAHLPVPRYSDVSIYSNRKP